MFSKIRSTLMFTVLFCLTAIGLFQHELRAEGEDLLLFPRRNAIVKLAFDVEYIRSVSMLSYEKNVEDPTRPFMHTWDPVSGEWVMTDLETYSSGNALAPAPRRVFIIGADTAATELLSDASSWCTDVSTITSLRSLDILNGLDAKMDLTRREWKWLAKRYKLDLQDTNAGRRRHGRYGPRGTEVENPDRKTNPLILWWRKRMGEGEKETEAAGPVDRELETKDEADPITETVDTEEAGVESAPAAIEEKGVPAVVPDEVVVPAAAKDDKVPAPDKGAAAATEEPDTAAEDK